MKRHPKVTLVVTLAALLAIVLASCAPQAPTPEPVPPAEETEETGESQPTDETNTDDELEWELFSEEFWEFLGGPDRVICAVSDTGNARCMKASDYTETYLDLYGIDLAREARFVWQDLMNSLDEETRAKIAGEASRGALVICGRRGAEELELDTPIGSQSTGDPFQLLSGDDLTKVLEACRTGMENGFELLDFGLGPLGSGDSYDRLVNETKERVERELDSCQDGPSYAPYEGAWMVGAELGHLFHILEYEAQIVYRKNQFVQGWRARQNEGWSIETCTGDSECERAWKKADEVCKANPGGCPEAHEPPGSPEPSGSPEPPEPSGSPEPSEPSGSPEPSETTELQTPGGCIDGAVCTPSCAEHRAGWEIIKNLCDSVGWRAQPCAGFVQEMSICPKPDRVLPLPDGNYECSRLATDEEVLAQGAVEACEKLPVLHIVGIEAIEGDTHRQLTCEPYEPQEVDPYELARTIMRSQCIYMLTDGGVCVGEIVPSVVVGGEESPPIPVPIAAPSAEP